MYRQTLTHLGLVILLLLFAAAAAYYVFPIRLNAPQVDIRKFSGNVVAVEDDKITLHGVFSGPAALPEDLASARDFSFKIDEATKFRKADIGWPTWEELATRGTSGSFNIQDLPRTEGDGSLDGLKNLFLLNAERVYVEADFLSPIHNSKDPIASSILYQLIGIPPPTPLPQTQNP